MAATTKRKRLPKELQDYKKEIKEQPFKDRVKAYFDCAPFLRSIDKQKREVILSTFSKAEGREFYSKYYPIYNAIRRYGDAMRAINAHRVIYANYIDTTFRQRDCYSYTADFLNLALPKVEEALKETKEEGTRETLTEALRILKSYRRVSSTAPDVKLNKKETSYEVLTQAEDKVLKGAIETLKGILSLIKCYLEALKEFLKWVGTPELFPKEFKDMETDLLIRFHNFKPQTTRDKNPDADKFPHLFSESEVLKEYISIDYEKLPRTVDMFGENNIFAEEYNSLFNTGRYGG